MTLVLDVYPMEAFIAPYALLDDTPVAEKLHELLLVSVLLSLYEYEHEVDPS